MLHFLLSINSSIVQIILSNFQHNNIVIIVTLFESQRNGATDNN